VDVEVVVGGGPATYVLNEVCGGSDKFEIELAFPFVVGEIKF